VPLPRWVGLGRESARRGLKASPRIAAGNRTRLLVSPDSIHREMNYNSGGEVSKETEKDARTAHIKLHHETGKWSTLQLPGN
jgi:hypothetical protein